MAAFQVKKISQEDLLNDFGVMGPFEYVLLGLNSSPARGVVWDLAACICNEDDAIDIDRALVLHRSEPSNESSPTVSRQNFEKIFESMQKYLKGHEARHDRQTLIDYAKTLMGDQDCS